MQIEESVAQELLQQAKRQTEAIQGIERLLWLLVGLLVIGGLIEVVLLITSA